MLYSIANDPTTSTKDLNKVLEVIGRWAYPIKQAVKIIFSCKKEKVNHPPLVFARNSVAKKVHQKHLFRKHRWKACKSRKDYLLSSSLVATFT